MSCSSTKCEDVLKFTSNIHSKTEDETRIQETIVIEDVEKMALLLDLLVVFFQIKFFKDFPRYFCQRVFSVYGLLGSFYVSSTIFDPCAESRIVNIICD